MKSPIARHAILAIILAAALPCAAFAQSDEIEPQAVTLLQSATDFLAARQSFSVDTRSTLEAVLTTGQKLEFDFAVTLSVVRPNRLRADRAGDLVNQVFSYDGKTLTLFNPDDGYYATAAAPPTIEGMLDFAREKLDIVAPAGDLVSEDAFSILMEDVTTAFVVGKAVVDGVVCNHLAFRNPDTDFQIWIEDGGQPLIHKMVITSADVAGEPDFSVLLTSWNLEPEFGEGFFTFVPPAEAMKIDFLPKTDHAPAR
jgi:hypothetical protein